MIIFLLKLKYVQSIKLCINTKKINVEFKDKDKRNTERISMHSLYFDFWLINSEPIFFFFHCKILKSKVKFLILKCCNLYYFIFYLKIVERISNFCKRVSLNMSFLCFWKDILQILKICFYFLNIHNEKRIYSGKFNL